MKKDVLILGDAIDELLKLKDDSVDHCITDPPYNISGYDNKKKIGWLKTDTHWSSNKNFNKIEEKWDSFSDKDYEIFTKKWLSEIFRVVKPNGNIIIFGSYHNIYKIGNYLQEADKRVINSIVWFKRNAFPNITQRMLCESTEHIIWAANNSQKKAKNWIFNYAILKNMNGGKQMRNVWDIPMTPGKEKKHGKHPSQKSEEVLKRLILGCTNENDIILDPFIGSGTTAAVAKMYSRNYIAIDNEKEYIDIATKRLDSISKVSLKNFI
jgi:site-specific DNA-methyltransferase (adenine-specific)